MDKNSQGELIQDQREKNQHKPEENALDCLSRGDKIKDHIKTEYLFWLKKQQQSNYNKGTKLNKIQLFCL